MVRYHKHVPNLWDDLDLGDLIGELGDFLLESGFGYEPGEWDEVKRALRAGKVYANVHSDKHPGGEIRGQLF